MKTAPIPSDPRWSRHRIHAIALEFLVDDCRQSISTWDGVKGEDVQEIVKGHRSLLHAVLMEQRAFKDTRFEEWEYESILATKRSEIQELDVIIQNFAATETRLRSELEDAREIIAGLNVIILQDIKSKITHT